MTLQLLISTLDGGINSVADLLLPTREGVSYLVSWQHTLGAAPVEVPRELRRPDVALLEMNGTGLSRNRNNTLRHATGDILLIADDDCRYRAEWLDAVVATFERHPTLALATFQMTSALAPKSYPDHEFSHSGRRPRGYYVTSFEIALRRSAVQGVVSFDERFGLGAPMLLGGEEELFVEAACAAGLDCRYFPTVVVRHDHATTRASRATVPGLLMARGAYLKLSRRYRRTALLRPLLIAWRIHRRHHYPYGKALAHIYRGYTMV